MSRELQYKLVVVVAWLVVAGLIIVPRFIFKATNATNADIVNAIYSLQSSLKDTIYTATTIGVGVILAVITRK